MHIGNKREKIYTCKTYATKMYNEGYNRGVMTGRISLVAREVKLFLYVFVTEDGTINLRLVRMLYSCALFYNIVL